MVGSSPDITESKMAEIEREVNFRFGHHQ
jgi:hypothetical protein